MIDAVISRLKMMMMAIVTTTVIMMRAVVIVGMPDGERILMSTRLQRPIVHDRRPLVKGRSPLAAVVDWLLLLIIDELKESARSPYLALFDCRT